MVNPTGNVDYQEWLEELLASNTSVQQDSALRQFLKQFLDQIHEFHEQNGSQILACRGKQRRLLPASAETTDNGISFVAQWFEFIQLGHTRNSGPQLDDGNRRFCTLPIKVQPSKDRTKFGVTDDTGYLFPALQHHIPRACFLVKDNLHQTVFIIHGTKKFAGQGDDGQEEGTAASSSNTTSIDVQSPPPKCFPGTDYLSPKHYIFSWKANGKNAGAFAYFDPEHPGDAWLFFNSKGVCECGGLLDEVMKDSSRAEDSFSEDVQNSFLPGIFQGFYAIWNHPSVDREKIKQLWATGYLILFEFNDNKHIVLERGEGGRPVNHMAFIGLVKQPTIGCHNTFHSGMAFEHDELFTFDLWKHQIKAPAYSCKPTVRVQVEHLDQAMKELLQGTFFRHISNTTSESHEVWYQPDHRLLETSAAATTTNLSGEGAVIYEIAENEDGRLVIRQLFKAKTATYITHRQFRGFLSRIKSEDVHSFEEFHHSTRRYCRQRFGELISNPYPDIKTFCDEPTNVVVEAASLFYAHFGMWLVEMANTLSTTTSSLLGVMNDILVPLESDIGKEYRLLGLRDSDVIVRGDQQHKEDMVAIKCGMAFRMAEFSALFGLDASKIFAAPREILEEMQSLETSSSSNCFPWKNVPAGYNGSIIVGSSHAFPDGEPSNRANCAEPQETTTNKNKRGKKTKKQKRAQINVLAPFQKAFRSFLIANPDVKLTVGSVYPERFVLTSSPDKEILCSAVTMEGFLEKLSDLPHLLDNARSETSPSNRPSRILDEKQAINSVISILKPAFPNISALFQGVSSLAFSDVTGRLVPLCITTISTNKNMLIIRGYPGLGKTTVAKAMKNLYGGEHVSIIETDDFFGQTCPYNPELLSHAHKDAQRRAREAMLDPSINLVIVSNTSTTVREYAPYIRIAQQLTQEPSLAVLTLDTKTPLEQIENVHEVPIRKVQKMATRLRNDENNPEGKTVESILDIADRQEAAFHAKTTQGPVVAWNVINSEGQAVLDRIFQDFVKFAADEGFVVPDSLIRPSSAHATQLFLRPASPKEELAQLDKIWNYHGREQVMTLGQVRYSVRTTCSNHGDEKESTGVGAIASLVNLALEVTSFSPHILSTETPHITIAYDANCASAVDSNRLWQTDGSKEAKTFFHDDSISRQICGEIQTGVLQYQRIAHHLPSWATQLAR